MFQTNLYIKGLKRETTDQDLNNMCKQYGNIRTTKAIIDKQTNSCKGQMTFSFIYCEIVNPNIPVTVTVDASQDTTDLFTLPIGNA